MQANEKRQPQAQPHRAAILEATSRAEEIVHRYFAYVRAERHEELGKSWKTSHPNDVVTHADREAQDAIERVLLAAFPEYGFYAEENGRNVSLPPERESARRFVVDPIDGTHNFTQGLADFSIAIAVQEARKGVWQNLAGLVALPAHGEIYYAEAGRTSYFRSGQETQLRVPVAATRGDLADIPVEDAIYAFSSSVFQEAVLRFRDNLQRAGGITRKSYSTAQRLAELAAGKGRALIVGGDFYEWDVAAGLAVAEQAGVAILRRQDFGLQVIVAAADAGLAQAVEHVWEASLRCDAPASR